MALTKEERVQVADTIIKQMGGYGKLSAMVGAKHFTVNESGVGFRFSLCRKANHLKVILNGDDTYTMQFYKMGKYDFKMVNEVDGVYWEMLKPIFEKYTGLYLSL